MVKPSMRTLRRVAGNGAMSTGTCKGKIPAYQGDVRDNEKMRLRIRPGDDFSLAEPRLLMA